MKRGIPVFLLTSLLLAITVRAQRPATTAETTEDARVLTAIDAAMPHEIDGWEFEGASSPNGKGLEGTTGFYNNRNFATRDVFDHQYNSSYRMVKPTGDIASKALAAKDKNDIEAMVSLTSCTIEIRVNSTFSNLYTSTALQKIPAGYAPLVFQDERGYEATVILLGKNWKTSVKKEIVEDGYNKPFPRWYLTAEPVLQHGTIVQSIQVLIKGNREVAAMITDRMDWAKLQALLGTGAITDDKSEQPLKKYFAEKAVPPVRGDNTLSFYYTGADGIEQQFSIRSAVHDRSNCALLRNHNEDPKILQEAHMDLYLQDDKDHNRLFMLSLPIIRTTGTVLATYQSDYDYQVMWRGNTDTDHSFTADSITITLTRWAPVGDFIEGTFSGIAMIHDHNDFSAEKPRFTIRNGTFRVRRMADQNY